MSKVKVSSVSRSHVTLWRNYDIQLHTTLSPPPTPSLHLINTDVFEYTSDITNIILNISDIILDIADICVFRHLVQFRTLYHSGYFRMASICLAPSVHLFQLLCFRHITHKVTALRIQIWTDPEGSRSLRAADFMTFATWGCEDCQLYAPAAFTSRKYSWHSFLFKAESIPGP
jgi:hypothetical protein